MSATQNNSSIMVPVSVCDEQLLLHHQRAVYWPRRKTLLLSDIHFGKEQAFQQSGIAIPAGSSRQDITRLAALVDETRPERLVILGDLVHRLPEADEPWLAEFNRWLTSCASLAVTVITGNHDKAGVEQLIHPAVAWHQQLAAGPFVLSHHPLDAVLDSGVEQGAATHVLCGHIHPAVSLSDGRADRIRLPVFWFGEKQSVLPAFGSFVGAASIAPSARDRVWAAGPDAVIDVTKAVVRSRRRSRRDHAGQVQL